MQSRNDNTYSAIDKSFVSVRSFGMRAMDFASVRNELAILARMAFMSVHFVSRRLDDATIQSRSGNFHARCCLGGLLWLICSGHVTATKSIRSLTALSRKLVMITCAFWSSQHSLLVFPQFGGHPCTVLLTDLRSLMLCFLT